MTITSRFNIYLEAVKWKPLAGWDWESDPYNPHNQLTFLVLQNKANWTQWRPYSVNDIECWKMALVSYNAGSGRVLKRRQYALAKGVKADRWTQGLEDAHSPAEDVSLYKRPLWEAVNEYPRVIFRRAKKYEGMV